MTILQHHGLATTDLKPRSMPVVNKDRTLKIFVLDDEINKYPRDAIKMALARHQLTLATSKDDAIVKYKGGYDLLLLDHDMRGFFEDSDFPNTGYQFVKWLISSCFRDRPFVFLHSHNWIGRYNMAELLNKHGFDLRQHAFNDAYVKLLKESYS